MTAPNDGSLPDFPIDVPTPARMYDYSLGGKDNFPVDRAAVLTVCQHYPSGLDTTRENRLFLYRVVRFMAEAGVRQFLDLGSGLPTQSNVHQVAQQFQPGARVVYVDEDPIVLAHGRALLADDETTTVIAADMTDTDDILVHPDVRRMIDFSEPVGVLLLSVSHSIVDDAKVEGLISSLHKAMAPGSYLSLSQMIGVDQEAVDESNEMIRTKLGIPWKNRLPEELAGFVREFEPVEPGLVNVKAWRPDPTQPPLAPVDEPLRPYIGAGANETRFMEYGGVLRRP